MPGPSSQKQTRSGAVANRTVWDAGEAEGPTARGVGEALTCTSPVPGSQAQGQQGTQAGEPGSIQIPGGRGSRGVRATRKPEPGGKDGPGPLEVTLGAFQASAARGAREPELGHFWPGKALAVPCLPGASVSHIDMGRDPTSPACAPDTPRAGRSRVHREQGDTHIWVLRAQCWLRVRRGVGERGETEKRKSRFVSGGSRAHPSLVGR